MAVYRSGLRDASDLKWTELVALVRALQAALPGVKITKVTTDDDSDGRFYRSVGFEVELPKVE